MIRLTDTYTDDLRDFAPPQEVRLYVCGITPYDAAHLGHVLTFLTYDLLQRRLEDLGHTVRLVRNITDVDEPIYKRAAENGEPYTELAARESEAFGQVVTGLNFRPAAAEPRASQYIDAMAEAVGQLLDNGAAYRLEDDIYFDTTTRPEYGRPAAFGEPLLSRLAADRGGDPARPGKRQPLDFLLWKGVPDPADPAAWQTPLGRGRPGWHIECTVMSRQLLGLPFDLHGGGSDLIFPHHASEIAQAEALGAPAVAAHWLHVAPLLLHGEKMSKSLGNLVFARDLLQDYEASAIRLAFMRYRYHTGGEWRHCVLEESVGLIDRLRRHLPGLPTERLAALVDELRECIDDDLDVTRGVHLLEVAVCHTAAGRPARPENLPHCQTIEKLLGIELYARG